MHRQAARQRALRGIGAEIAGRLRYLHTEAQRVGLEAPRAEAFDAARAVLGTAFGITPWAPKPRKGADNDLAQ